MALFLGPLSSEALDWSRAPAIDAAQVATFAVTRAGGTRLFLGCRDGAVYRSDNRGASWVLATRGLPLDQAIGSFETSPASRDVAWVNVGGMVYRTTNGGSSWQLATSGLVGWVACMSADPGNPTRLIAGTQGHGVFETRDSGDHWKPTGQALATRTVSSLARQPGSPEVLLAGTSIGVQRSTDSGVSWEATASFGPRVAWSADPNIAFATEDYYLLKSTDAGISWAELSTPFWNLGLLACAPTDASRVLIGANIWQGGPVVPHIARSTDGGATFAEVYNGAPYYNGSYGGYLSGLAFDPTSSSRTYYSTWSYEVRGEFRRSDSGGALNSWSMQRNGLSHAEVPSVRPGPASSVYARTRDHFWASSNAGSSWSGHEFAYPMVGGYSLEPNLRTPGFIHEGRKDGYPPVIFTDPILARTTNGGATWFNATGLPTVQGYPFSIVVSAHGTGEIVYTWTGEDGRFYRSTDAGSTFAAVGLPTPEPRNGVMDPMDPDRLFVLMQADPRVRLTTDGGETWEGRSAGLPSSQGVRLLMNPGNSDHLLVTFATRGVFVTTDGGLNWSPRPGATLVDSPTGDHPGVPAVVDVAWRTAAPDRVFLATSQGVYVEDRGWMSSGLPTRRLTSIAYSQPTDYLLVGTAAHGMFRVGAGSLADGTESAPAIRPPHRAPPVSVAVTPNPMLGPTEIRLTGLSPGSPADLRIFDAAGRLVRTLSGGTGSGGVVRWDGRDKSGRLTAAGVYFVQVRQGDSRETVRITRLR